jgi:S-adenosylmethionine hydrolase
MTKNVIAFLSDVGTTDDATALCKGLILSICPDCTIVDVTHNVTPFDVEEGASYLGDIPDWFPRGTVVCAYVYPETGTETPTVALRNVKDQILVVPDNGLATCVIERAPVVAAYEVTEPAIMRYPPTPTWHGRDVVVAAAAHLAAGFPLDAVGPGRATDSLRLLDLRGPTEVDGTVTGQVVRIDSSFGNVWTDITLDLITGHGDPFGKRMVIDLGDRGSFELTLRRTFGEVGLGEPLAYVNSRGLLAFGLNQGSMAEQYGLHRGMPVRMRQVI